MKKLSTLLVSALLISLMAFTAQAEQKFEEELHYFSVIPEQPGGEGDRVQMVEFFWYGCPHCFTLEPHLKSWLSKKPDNVDFVRIPAMFNRPEVILHAQTYYALELMGVIDEVHGKLFEAINEDRRPLKTQAQMEEFLDEQGVDLESYRKSMKSFAVQTQARRAAVLASRFDVRGVPAIVVDGKYRTGGLQPGLMLEVTDYLIGRVAEEKMAGRKAQ